MTPILIIVFGFKPSYAVGTDIFHGAVFKSFGAVRHRRLGTVHSHLALWLFAGSGPLAVAGVTVSYVLPELDQQCGDRPRLRDRRGADRRRRRLPRQVVRKAGNPAERGAVHHEPPGQADRARHRRGLRLDRRNHLGRQRHVLRADDGARLPAHDAADRRYGHLPRRRAALGRRRRPSHHRRRRPSRDRVAAPRLGAGNPHLEPLHGEGPGHDDSLRSRRDPDPQRDQAPQHARGERDPRRWPDSPPRRPHDLHREGDGERVPCHGRVARNAESPATAEHAEPCTFVRVP